MSGAIGQSSWGQPNLSCGAARHSVTAAHAPGGCVPGAESLVQLDPETAIPSDLPGRWWVAHTRSRNEKALVGDLHRMGVFYYLPLQERVSRSPRTRRWVRSAVPVFPGYVFFNGDEDQRVRTLTTHRVANILTVVDPSVLVADLRRIHRALVSGAHLELFNTIAVGDWARVIAGPLEGLEGVVCRVSGRFRLSLNVEMLGQSAMVEVDRDMIEPIDPPRG